MEVLVRARLCGEGIYPRWTAQQSHFQGPLRDPTGINPLTTKVAPTGASLIPRQAERRATFRHSRLSAFHAASGERGHCRSAGAKPG